MLLRNMELQGCAFQEELNTKVLIYFFCVSLNKKDEDYGTLVVCYAFLLKVQFSKSGIISVEDTSETFPAEFSSTKPDHLCPLE